MHITILLSTSIIILLISFYMAISSRDIIRLLISLELMFNAIFIALIPLFTIGNLSLLAFAILIIALFSSASEFASLIISIIYLDKQLKSISIDEISRGGDKV